MRIFWVMQRDICGDQSVLGCNNSFRRGIGVTAHKARTRDKFKSKFSYL